jgi:hypothetical protein
MPQVEKPVPMLNCDWPTFRGSANTEAAPIRRTSKSSAFFISYPFYVYCSLSVAAGNRFFCLTNMNRLSRSIAGANKSLPGRTQASLANEGNRFDKPTSQGHPAPECLAKAGWSQPKVQSVKKSLAGKSAQDGKPARPFSKARRLYISRIWPALLSGNKTPG